MPGIPSLHPAIALIAYAESLVEGRRVVVFGDARSGIAERLVERGARLVQVCDSDPGRVAEAATLNASRNIAFSPVSEGGLGVRDGAFDLALIPDVAAFDHPAGILRRLQRLLQGRGVALVGCPNRDARTRLQPLPLVDLNPSVPLDYYGLYDLVTAEFEHVRMLGQSPFMGYTVSDFAPDGELEPAIDTGFLPGGSEEPEWFIALAARVPVALDAYTIVGLPTDQVVSGGDRAALEEELNLARRGEMAARERMAALEAERRAHQLQDPIRTAEVGRLQAQLDKRDQWIKRLEERASTADLRADEAQEQLDEARENLAQLEQRFARLEAEATRTTTLSRELEESLRAAEARFAIERGQLTRELAQAKATVRSELDQAQAQLVHAHTKLQDTRHGIGAELAQSQVELGRSRDDLGRAEQALARMREEMDRHRAEAERFRVESERRQAESERFRIESERRQAESERFRIESERLRAEPERLRAEPERLRAELESERAQRQVTEKSLAAQLESAQQERDLAQRSAREIPEALEREALAEVGGLEAQLRERAATIAQLERQLREARRTGRELVLRLNEAEPAETQQREMARLQEELLARLAEREADCQAAQWTVELLAAKLASAEAASDCIPKTTAAASDSKAAAALIGHDASVPGSAEPDLAPLPPSESDPTA